MAVHVRGNEYDLLMSNDLNDRSANSNTTQWFHFAVWNAQPGVTYKLNLVNFSKPASLFGDLQQQLASLMLHCSLRLPPGQPSPVVRSLLCYTLTGQRCDMLTITDFAASATELSSREYVVITARVHPGETCASWIAQGAVDFLVSDDPLAQRLRRCFVFKLVPMLNPDGVVAGNYRSSLAGVDLNRCWDKAIQQLHPTIFHARKLLEALVDAGRLALTIDIHGHSSALDAFFYGCEPLLVKPTAAERRETKAAAAAAAAAAGSVLTALAVGRLAESDDQQLLAV
ncbi:hypothetical protein OEZ85_013024 [Tetradesmus obliquus]|uniref:Peptidase M14 domain-containing protein n=1 Tax=Tetradesmus obliquus TaxID=3088 RepID=A0ABY8U542_TETOB|nr:hypothetical protein OEZ85_013024 [Tetradesmus obliquus]